MFDNDVNGSVFILKPPRNGEIRLWQGPSEFSLPVYLSITMSQGARVATLKNKCIVTVLDARPREDEIPSLNAKKESNAKTITSLLLMTEDEVIGWLIQWTDDLKHMLQSPK